MNAEEIQKILIQMLHEAKQEDGQWIKAGTPLMSMIGDKFNDTECPFRTVRKLAFRSMKTPLPAPPTEDELAKKSIPNLLVQPIKAKHIELPEGMKMIRAFS